MLHLVFVRHGESIRNYLTDLARAGHPALLVQHLRTCPEESEWPLTDLGHQQARLAGDFIRTEIGGPFERASVSPFVRAQETASGLGFDLPWRVDIRLRERLWGDYPTAIYTVDEYVADLHHCAEPAWRAPFPNSESVTDLEEEAASFLVDQPLDGSVIAVTHGGTLGAIQRVLEVNPPHRAIGNCGVLEYQLEPQAQGWRGRARFACPAFGDEKFGDWTEFGSR